MKIVKKVISIIITLLIIGWLVIVFMDYFKIREQEKPTFCIKEETHKYDDGETYECLGLGYRAFIYERDSISATEFGPFFIKEQKSNE